MLTAQHLLLSQLVSSLLQYNLLLFSQILLFICKSNLSGVIACALNVVALEFFCDLIPMENGEFAY